MIVKEEVGVKFPFTIAGGSVVSTTNQSEIVGSRVTFCLGTQVGERLMAPSWGINILQAMYEMEGEPVGSVIRAAVETAFRQWFPDYQVRKVEVLPDKVDLTMVRVKVHYGLYGGAVDAIANIGTPVPGGSEMFKNEGLAT